jgi:hypothetical protein
VPGPIPSRTLISGVTHDLRQLPAVVLGWAEGASLDQIAEAAPFEVLTGRFEVPDNNHSDIIESEWQWMLKDARFADWPQYQALINAAYAQPRLRRLYPFTSHWSLSFSATPDYPFTPSFVSIDSPRGEGDYTIREWWNGPALTQVSTPAEAIVIAVGHIPADLLLQTPSDITAEI